MVSPPRDVELGMEIEGGFGGGGGFEGAAKAEDAESRGGERDGRWLLRQQGHLRGSLCYSHTRRGAAGIVRRPERGVDARSGERELGCQLRRP